MNFLIIHNEYSIRGGEESVVEFQKTLLEKHGHKVVLYTRSYSEMNKWFLGKFWGMFTSVVNFRSFRDLNAILKEDDFDAVILHNLFPIISPAIIPFLRKKGLKVFQIVHNYRLFCPIGILYRDGKICKDCIGKGREWNCFKNRCAGNAIASFSFFVRYYFVRKLGYYNKVNNFLCLNKVQMDLIKEYLNPKSKVSLLPNAIDVSANNEIKSCNRKYISFVGRITEEKGFNDFLKIAKKMPDYEFAVAGAKNNFQDREMPSNVKFFGFLDKEQLNQFYLESKVLLFLSNWYEGFSMVVIEAMKRGVPVVAYDILAAKDVVENGKNGFIVSFKDYDAIVSTIERLFSDNMLFESLSAFARERVVGEYSENRYYERLIDIVKSEIDKLISY